MTRLSPLQALLSISVVDGIPLAPGEEFIGVIRVQDVRATEKDKVKIAECFRGGDVVRGQVVSRLHRIFPRANNSEDISGRCTELFCYNCPKRPRSDIRDERVR